MQKRADLYTKEVKKIQNSQKQLKKSQEMSDNSLNSSSFTIPSDDELTIEDYSLLESAETNYLLNTIKKEDQGKDLK